MDLKYEFIEAILRYLKGLSAMARVEAVPFVEL